MYLISSLYFYSLDIVAWTRIQIEDQQREITSKTRCVCEIRMPPKQPFFEKCNPYI